MAGFFSPAVHITLWLTDSPKFLIRLKDQNTWFAVKGILAETDIHWTARRRS
jgi:hypothetical protein